MDYEFRKFYGSEGEDVKRWLSKLVLLLTAVGIHHDGREASAFLALHLAGIAESWYFTLPKAKQINFRYLKDALAETFSLPYMFKYNLRQELYSRKQGKGEPLDRYAELICRTCQTIGISDAEQMNCFINGLRNNTKREVLMKTPKTYDEALSIAQHVEAVARILSSKDTFPEFVETLYTDSYGRNLNSLSRVEHDEFVSLNYESYVAQIQQHAEFKLHREMKNDTCSLNNHGIQGLQNQCQRPKLPKAKKKEFRRANRVCFLCQKPGHIARNCRTAMFARTSCELIKRNESQDQYEENADEPKTQVELVVPNSMLIEQQRKDLTNEAKTSVDSNLSFGQGERFQEANEHSNAEMDKRTSILTKQSKQEICDYSLCDVDDNAQTRIYSAEKNELLGENIIDASGLYEANQSYSHDHVETAEETFEVKNDSHEAVLELDPEKIVGDTIENFIDDNQMSNGANNKAEVFDVEWDLHQSQVSLDAKPSEPAAELAICPGFPNRIDCKGTTDKAFTEHKLNNSSYVILVLLLLSLFSVALKSVERETRKFNDCKKLLLPCNSNTILTKELLWLWRK